MLRRLIQNPCFRYYCDSYMLSIILKCFRISQQIPPSVFGKFCAASPLKSTFFAL
eukprot:UN06071